MLDNNTQDLWNHLFDRLLNVPNSSDYKNKSNDNEQETKETKDSTYSSRDIPS